jgi:hypothetical protein
MITRGNFPGVIQGPDPHRRGGAIHQPRQGWGQISRRLTRLEPPLYPRGDSAMWIFAHFFEVRT